MKKSIKSNPLSDIFLSDATSRLYLAGMQAVRNAFATHFQPCERIEHLAYGVTIGRHHLRGHCSKTDTLIFIPPRLASLNFVDSFSLS